MRAVLKTMGVVPFKPGIEKPIDGKTAINIASFHKRIPKEATSLAWSIDQV